MATGTVPAIAPAAILEANRIHMLFARPKARNDAPVPARQSSITFLRPSLSLRAPHMGVNANWATL